MNFFLGFSESQFQQTSREISEEILRRAYFAVKQTKNGLITIPGFCSFDKNMDFVDYLQEFCYQLSSLNP